MFFNKFFVNLESVSILSVLELIHAVGLCVMVTCRCPLTLWKESARQEWQLCIANHRFAFRLRLLKASWCLSNSIFKNPLRIWFGIASEIIRVLQYGIDSLCASQPEVHLEALVSRIRLYYEGKPDNYPGRRRQMLFRWLKCVYRSRQTRL
jgi:hypothetical protein